jgi:flavin-binding protein dodecin
MTSSSTHFLIPTAREATGVPETARLGDRLGFEVLAVQDHPYGLAHLDTVRAARRHPRHRRPTQEARMADSVYRDTEVIGVSGESWEAAARNAVETAAKSVRDLRVAEVIREDVTIENGKVVNYRVRLGISFKYETGD